MVTLKAHRVVPQKPAPTMTTEVPTAPVGGENDVIDGATAVATMKLAALGVSPPPALTVIGPVVAPTGTIAVSTVVGKPQSMRDRRLTVERDAGRRRRIPVPLMVTVVPAAPAPATPHTGVNEVTVDAANAGSAVTQHAYHAEYKRQRGRAGGDLLVPEPHRGSSFQGSLREAMGATSRFPRPVPVHY